LQDNGYFERPAPNAAVDEGAPSARSCCGLRDRVRGGRAARRGGGRRWGEDGKLRQTQKSASQS